MKKIIMTMEELDEAQAHFDKLGSYTKNHFGLGIVDSIIATAKAFHESRANEDKCNFCDGEIITDVICLNRCQRDQ